MYTELGAQSNIQDYSRLSNQFNQKTIFMKTGVNQMFAILTCLANHTHSHNCSNMFQMLQFVPGCRKM